MSIALRSEIATPFTYSVKSSDSFGAVFCNHNWLIGIGIVPLLGIPEHLAENQVGVARVPNPCEVVIEAEDVHVWSLSN